MEPDMLSVDPTSIDLDLDPLTQRFRGIAVHGDTPFDVPYISPIVDGLWMGGCETGLVLPPHIDNLVSLYPWERYTVRHKLKREMYVRQYDDLDGPDIAEMMSLVQVVTDGMDAGEQTLVHCQAGLNRSGRLCALVLMVVYDIPADEAIDRLRAARSPAVLCNPAMVAWLREVKI